MYGASGGRRLRLVLPVFSSLPVKTPSPAFPATALTGQSDFFGLLQFRIRRGPCVSMKLTAIKPGHWYETRQGVGLCLSIDTGRPPSARFRIVSPIPRGVVWLSPRDVLAELPPPASDP